MTDEESATNDPSLEKPLIAETKICSICLVSGSTDDSDPIVYCDRCGIIVHESCYNADTLDDKSSDSSSPCEYWFCTPCLAHVDEPICALCPTKDRCNPFWPTLESSWVHVICALGVPGVLFYDELYYTPVDLSNISALKFGSKLCHLCDSRSGVTVSCDAGLCPNAFHLSCAHRHGLLQIRGELSKIECEVYCESHQSATQTYKNVQRNSSIGEVQQKELDQRGKLKEEILQSLNEHYIVYQKRSEAFPRLPCPSKTHLPRSLTVDPIALKKFFDKAQRLRVNQRDFLPNNVDLTSPDINALIAFKANEEELTAMKQKIAEVQQKLKLLETSASEKQLKEENRKLETELKKEYETLGKLTEKSQQWMEIFHLFHCPLKEQTKNQLENSKSSPIPPTTSNDFQCCSVCRQSDRSNQMIRCCQCQLAFHGDCLKPPMPPKTLSLMLTETKKYQWQCALCVNAQQEELDQCHVDVDQPRQIRPRKTNELVLHESLIKFGSGKKRKDSTKNESNQQKKKRKSSAAKTEHEEEKATASNNQSRTAVIQQLFSRTTTDFTPSKETAASSPRKTPTDQSSPSRSAEKSLQTPARAQSLTGDRQTPKIFKQKALSAPTTKPEKKKNRQTMKKDPMSIFDFEDNESETVQLRSSLNNARETIEEKKEKKGSRRSKSQIANDVPPETQCKECSNPGTSQNMTDCDQCQHFYHYSCCVPPLTSFPKRRNYGWTCHHCNEDTDHDHSTTDLKRERKSLKQSDGNDPSNED